MPVSSENRKYPLPVFLKVDGRKCLVVGGGAVASRKIADLLECGADVVVVDGKPLPGIERLHEDGTVRLLRRVFRPEDLDGAFLVYAATGDESVNGEVSRLAQERGIPVNAVDNPDHCTFISGATVKRGPLRIAVSTSGACPALAGAIRRELEEAYDESYGKFVAAAGKMRRFVLDDDTIDRHKIPELLAWLADGEALRLFRESGEDAVWNRLKRKISSSPASRTKRRR